jgi:hypothetical protein
VKSKERRRKPTGGSTTGRDPFLRHQSAFCVTILASDELTRLDGFQADFSLLLGTGFADPDYAAALGAERLFIEDKFDHLAAPKVETSAQPETFFRGIEHEAGEPLRFAVQIDD